LKKTIKDKTDILNRMQRTEEESEEEYERQRLGLKKCTEDRRNV